MRRVIASVGLAVGLSACFNPGAKGSQDSDSTGTDSAATGESTDASTAGSTAGSEGTSGTASPQCPGAQGCDCSADPCDQGLTCVLDVCTACGDGEVGMTEQCDGAVDGGECVECMVVCNDRTHAECDGELTTCESLESSSDHCGGCGHGCLGAACSNARCEPIVLAENLGQPLGIVTDGTTVYWADQGTGAPDTGRILSHGVDPGGDPVVLAMDQGSPERVAIDDAHVYWGNTTSGGIFRVGHDGTNLEDFLPAEPVPKRLIVADGTLFWTRFQTAGAVVMSPLDVPSAQPVATGQPFATGLAVDGMVVYWTSRDDGAVRRADLGQDPIVVEDVATGQARPVAVVVADGVVYWANEGTQAAAFLDGSVHALDGEDTIIAAQEARPSDLVVDDTDVYWVNRVQQGAVRRASLAGGDAEDLVSNAAQPGGIAQDQVAIYYTEQMAGRVLKVAK